MAYHTNQKIDERDVRRFKQCFALGEFFRPNCEYIERMTGLTLHSIAKVAKLTRMKPVDLAYCLKRQTTY